jgi:hypothetical protein
VQKEERKSEKKQSELDRFLLPTIQDELKF